MRAVGVNFTGILGLGITVSVGKVTVNGPGESSWFISAGVGAGLDAGISGFGTYYIVVTHLRVDATNAKSGVEQRTKDVKLNVRYWRKRTSYTLRRK